MDKLETAEQPEPKMCPCPCHDRGEPYCDPCMDEHLDKLGEINQIDAELREQFRDGTLDYERENA